MRPGSLPALRAFLEFIDLRRASAIDDNAGVVERDLLELAGRAVPVAVDKFLAVVVGDDTQAATAGVGEVVTGFQPGNAGLGQIGHGMNLYGGYTGHCKTPWNGMERGWNGMEGYFTAML